MTRRAIEIRVGLVVVIASVILVVGTMWFQRFQLTESRYPVYVVFSEVGGLVSGDPVFVNGVERGRVGDVQLLQNRVVAEVGIEDGVPIPGDSRVVLKSIGIMGERFVAITQGAGPPVSAGDTLDGTFLAGMSEVMGSAGTIVDDIAETSRNLREVVEMLTAEGRLQKTLENLTEASGNVRDLTADNAPRLEQTIARFEHVATLMDSLVSGHYASLDSAMAAFGRAGGRVEVAVDNLAGVSDDLKEITTAIRSGEGTLGRLVQDDALVVRMEATVAGLDSLIADIKRNPKRYVTIKIF